MKMEKNFKLTSHEVIEAAEQVRAGYTVARQAYAAITLLYSLDKKDKEWAEKVSKVHNDYFELIINSYKELEAIAISMEEEEKKKEVAAEQ